MGKSNTVVSDNKLYRRLGPDQTVQNMPSDLALTFRKKKRDTWSIRAQRSG